MGCHPLCAPLAHADPVTVPAGFQHKLILLFHHGNDFVIRPVNGKVQGTKHSGKNLQGQGAAVRYREENTVHRRRGRGSDGFRCRHGFGHCRRRWGGKQAQFRISVRCRNGSGTGGVQHLSAGPVEGDRQLRHQFAFIAAPRCRKAYRCNAVNPQGGHIRIQASLGHLPLQGIGQQLQESIRQLFTVLVQASTLDGAFRVLHIVGVIRHLIVTPVPLAAPDGFDLFCLPAVTGGIVAGCQCAFVSAYHAGCFLHGLNGIGVAVVNTKEHLVGRGIHHVIGRGGVQMRHGVGSGADGLSFQCLQRKAIAHFVGNNTQQVFLNGQCQYRHQLPILHGKG